jgi:hypothetical protein
MTGDRGSTATNPSYALAISAGNPVVDARDNILSNTQTTTGTGKSYAIGVGDSVFTNLLSNYNDLHVGGGSAFLARTRALGNAGGVDDTTLAQWQARAGQDANSISADPVFAGTNDLHIASGASPVGGVGIPVGGVTVDFDGEAGNRTTTPDIGADEFVAWPTLAIADTSALENAGSITFTVRMSFASPDTVKFLAYTVNGTALADSDYAALSPPQLVTIAPGDTEATVAVTLVNDAVVEPDETFSVHVTGAVNAAIADSVATGTILNDDAITGVIGSDIPDRPYLAPNFPNPFGAGTTIAFGLSRGGNVKLEVFDIAGRLVKTVRNGFEQPGRFKIRWDGADNAGNRMSAGVYLLRMETAGVSFTRSMRLIR